MCSVWVTTSAMQFQTGGFGLSEEVHIFFDCVNLAHVLVNFSLVHATD